MNQTLWNGIGQINDNLISGAEIEKVRAYFKKRKRNLWVRYVSLAACLCLVVCLCLPLVGTILSGSKNEADDGHNCPEVDPNDKSVSNFADLNFSCTNSYTDADGNDILLFDVHINHWINNADGYVKQLYIRSDNDGFIGISAFGRELTTVQINEKEFFALDTTQEKSVYNLDLYLSIRYAPGKLIRSESYDNINSMTVYLNGTDESCRGEIRFYFYENNNDMPVILNDIEALRELTDAVLPTVFPTEATLVNQIFWYSETEAFTVIYRTDNIHEEYTVSRRDSATAYGGQKKKTYLFNGTEYTIITDEAGYEYPPFNIDFWTSGYYYNIRVDVRQPVDVYAFIHGLSAE